MPPSDGTFGGVCRLVDTLGGIDAAVALVKEAAKIPPDEEVTLMEVSTSSFSLLGAITGSTGLTRWELLRLVFTDPAFVAATLGFSVLPAVLKVRQISSRGMPLWRVDVLLSSGAVLIRLAG
jgi:hypothetical protein